MFILYLYRDELILVIFPAALTVTRTVRGMAAPLAVLALDLKTRRVVSPGWAFTEGRTPSTSGHFRYTCWHT